MKFALTQMNIQWENPDANRILCRQSAKRAAAAGCDWIIFPEMTLTGFTMQPEHFAETPNGEAASFFCELSQTCGIGIIYGYIADADDRYYNRLVYVQNGCIIGEYTKLHPFSFGEETLHYSKGDSPLTLRTASGICISGFICYDLRFPEIFQAVSKQAEIIIVIANWPAARIAHWYTLLQARAIENQCFLLGVNRSGTGGGISYPASSAAYSPTGELLTPSAVETIPANLSDTSGIIPDNHLLYVELNPAKVTHYRQEFPLKSDRREELYQTFYL